MAGLLTEPLAVAGLLTEPLAVAGLLTEPPWGNLLALNAGIAAIPIASSAKNASSQ